MLHAHWSIPGHVTYSKKTYWPLKPYWSAKKAYLPADKVMFKNARELDNFTLIGQLQVAR